MELEEHLFSYWTVGSEDPRLKATLRLRCPPPHPRLSLWRPDLQQQTSLHGLPAGDEVRLHEQDVLAQLLQRRQGGEASART